MIRNLNEERVSTRRMNLRNISASLRYNFDKIALADSSLLPGFKRLGDLSGLYGKFLTEDCYIVIDTDPNGDSIFLQTAILDTDPNSDVELENQYDLEIHITNVNDEEEIRDAIKILQFAGKLIQKKWQQKGLI